MLSGVAGAIEVVDVVDSLSGDLFPALAGVDEEDVVI